VSEYCSQSCQLAHSVAHKDYCESFKQSRTNPSFTLFSDQRTPLSISVTEQLKKKLLIPFDLIPFDHYLLIAEFLDSESLCQVSIVSKLWYNASNDSSIWNVLCLTEWTDKQNYTKLLALAIASKRHWKKSYYYAIRDAKRESITLNELCETTWSWKFHPETGWGGHRRSLAAYFTPTELRMPAIRTFPWHFLEEKQTTEQEEEDDFEYHSHDIEVLQSSRMHINSRFFKVGRLAGNWGWQLLCDIGLFVSVSNQSSDPLSEPVTEDLDEENSDSD